MNKKAMFWTGLAASWILLIVVDSLLTVIRSRYVARMNTVVRGFYGATQTVRSVLLFLLIATNTLLLLSRAGDRQ